MPKRTPLHIPPGSRKAIKRKGRKRKRPAPGGEALVRSVTVKAKGRRQKAAKKP